MSSGYGNNAQTLHMAAGIGWETAGCGGGPQNPVTWLSLIAGDPGDPKSNWVWTEHHSSNTGVLAGGVAYKCVTPVCGGTLRLWCSGTSFCQELWGSLGGCPRVANPNTEYHFCYDFSSHPPRNPTALRAQDSTCWEI